VTARATPSTAKQPGSPPSAGLPKTLEPQDGEFRIPSWRPGRRVQMVLLANVALASFYVVWWLVPGRMGTPVLFYLLAAAEGFTIMHHLGLWWALSATRVDPPPPARTRFTIDVLIPTLGEPLDVLAHTISAAVGMDLPHETYVLDDGARPEVEALARRLGARYIARRRAERRFAKAGNLNHALRRTSGDLVAIFDADHAPRADFMTRIVGYFEDPSVGFVQTPQFYGNSSESEVARGAYLQQAIFYGPICRGRNGLSAAFCCGTNVLFRRAALEDVGGFEHRTVVEDFVTSMRIHRRGWTSVYYPYVLAEGMGPATLHGYFRQQFRWARGSIGALLRLEPFRRGLTLGQRVQYLLGTTFYLIGLVTAIYVALPILYFLGGWSTFSVVGGSFMFFYIPYAFLALLTIRWGLGGDLRLEHLQFTFGSFPVYSLAALAAVLHLPARFRVTKKSRPGERTWPPLLAWVTTALFLTTAVSIPVGLVLRPFDAPTVTNLSWALVDLMLTYGIVRCVFLEVRERVRPAREPALETARLHPLLPIAGAAQDVVISGYEVLARSDRLSLPENILTPRTSPVRRTRINVRVAARQVAVITAVGFALRLALLGTQSLRIDEWTSLWISQLSIPSIWHLLSLGSTSEVHPPLMHMILHYWTAVAGTSEWALRFPSAVFGTAAIPLLFLVGRRLVGVRAAVLAAAIGAVAPLWVWHSDEARMYSMLLFFGLLSTHSLFEAADKGGRKRWVLYSVATGIGFYTQYMSLLLLPVHLAYLLVNRVPRRKLLAWIGGVGGALAVYLPWIAMLAVNFQPGGFDSITNFFRAPPIAYTAFGIVWGLPAFLAVFLVGYQSGPVLATVGLVVSGWPLLAFLGSTARPKWLRTREAAFLLMWVLFMVVFLLTVGLWKPGIWLQRYLFMLTPPLFLLVGRGVSRLVRRQWAGVCLVLATFLAMTLVNNFDTSNPARDDFRSAASFIEQDSRPGEVVFVYPGFDAGPFEYYFDPDSAVVDLDAFSGPKALPARAVFRQILDTPAVRQGRPFWIVLRIVSPEQVGYGAFGGLRELLGRAYARTATYQIGQVVVRRYRVPATNTNLGEGGGG
jgi:cellulose synthase (UDP-forming)